MGLRYEDIKPIFLSRLERDRQATALMASIESGSATYATVTQYAARVGEILGEVLKFNAPITDISDWDIDDLIPGSLGLDHRIVTNACRTVQESLNRDAGIGIRYQEPSFDWDRVHGIVDELRSNPEFINIEETFYDQLTNFSQNVVDSSVRVNASIASSAGIKTYVIRTASTNACQWCQEAAGQYDYESVKQTGDPVWLRHENCNCTIDYVTERNGSTYRERVYDGDDSSDYIPVEETVIYEGYPRSWNRLSEVTPDRVLEGCNPNWNPNMSRYLTGTTDDYSTNCTNCVVAYDLRTRGMDVTANSTGACGALMTDMFSAWIGGTPINTDGDPYSCILDYFERNSECRRVAVGANRPRSVFYESSGHAFLMERRDDGVVLVDAQSERIYNRNESIVDYFLQYDSSSVMFMRIDDLDISDRGISACKAV